MGWLWRPGSWIWVWVWVWVCEAPRVKVWTSCAQWQCTCVEHKNGYEVRWGPPLVPPGPPGHCCPILAPLAHTPRLCHSFNQIKWLIIGPNMFNVFCTKYCDLPPHHPIAHILISLKILMNRIIIKTHWAEVRRAGYKRNPSHETWAQLASQRAARCTLWSPSSSSSSYQGTHRQDVHPHYWHNNAKVSMSSFQFHNFLPLHFIFLPWICFLRSVSVGSSYHAHLLVLSRYLLKFD